MRVPRSLVILGAPAAGKTVFLATLYHHLWQGFEGMTMRASAGGMHQELLATAGGLQRGTLPAATQAVRAYEFELEINDAQVELQCLDYPGELFRRAFFDMAVDSPEAQQLMQACQEAEAAILLVDPQTVVDNPSELDFMLSNVFRYAAAHRKRPQLVLAFTKRDATANLVENTTRFVRKYLPRCAKDLRRGLHVMHFASIIRSEAGIQLARADTVIAPINALLEGLHTAETRRFAERLQRRSAVVRATRMVSLILAVLLVSIGVFLAGAYVRQRVDVQRGSLGPPLEEVGE